MAPIRNRAVSGSVPVVDDHSGAVYYRAKSDNDLLRLSGTMAGRIGSGSNGLVLLVRSTTQPDLLMAAKNFLLNFTDDARNDARKKAFMKETAILQHCDHPNIVRQFYSVMGPRRGMILMDFCPRGALYVEGLDDERVHKYFTSILNAVQHIHSKGIVHRDIKLDNILVKNDDVLLADFGSAAKVCDGERLVSGVVGTWGFMAPEVFRASPYSLYDGFKADSYSMGVFLWCLLLRREEPEDREVFTYWNILQRSSQFHVMDATLTDCARQLLEGIPKQRQDVTSLHARLCGKHDACHSIVEAQDLIYQNWETLGAEEVVI